MLVINFCKRKFKAKFQCDTEVHLPQTHCPKCANTDHLTTKKIIACVVSQSASKLNARNWSKARTKGSIIKGIPCKKHEQKLKNYNQLMLI